MSAKSQSLYAEATAQTLEQQLDQLAAKPKGLALRTLIERLRPKIKAAQIAGYTYEEIVSTLAAGEVKITVNTLKQYLREPRTEVEDDKSQTPPNEDSHAGKRAPVGVAATTTAKKSVAATNNTASQTVSAVAPTPIDSKARNQSAQVRAQESQPVGKTETTAALSTEDRAQTVSATNLETAPRRLTNTNSQDFQEMRSDDDL